MAHFTVTSSFWLRPSSYLHHSFILRRSHLLPDQLPGEHTGLPPYAGSVHSSICLQSHGFTHFTLTHSHLVGKSMVVGHILMVHTCSFNVHQSHRPDSRHPSLLFTKLGITHIYVDHSTVGIVMYAIPMGAIPFGWSPIHVLTRLMIT